MIHLLRTIRLTLFPVLVVKFVFLTSGAYGAAHNTQLPLIANPAPATLPDLYEATISELQAGLEQGHFTSVDLVTAYLARVEEVNLQGPALRAVIETNTMALAFARALDTERYVSGPRGPLHGIPIIVKDNIATVTREGMNTTAGSLALLNSVVPRDAHVVKKLWAAGAIILGKANLSEWSHARGIGMPLGWSARGGQCTSPYVPQGDPSGSSSGSAVSTAIGLVAAALGTETDESIIVPCSRGNLVGIKPTVGLTSRAGVIPISLHQDTVGPMARSVADAATLLSVLAGQDERDNYTLAQPSVVPDYTLALKKDGLKGVRLGVPRKRFANVSDDVMAVFNASLDVIRGLGATVVDPADLVNHEEFETYRQPNETLVTSTDLKMDLNRYIAGLLKVPSGVKDLADVIAYNLAHADEELVEPYWTDQSDLIFAQNLSLSEAYYAAIVTAKDLGGKRGIDATLQQFNVSALIMPSEVASAPAALAGYPIVGVPLGFLPANTILSPATPIRSAGPNQPFGLSFVGTAFSEFDLISYAYAYEQATHTRLKGLAYPAAIPKTQLVDVVGKKHPVVFKGSLDALHESYWSTLSVG